MFTNEMLPRRDTIPDTTTESATPIHFFLNAAISCAFCGIPMIPTCTTGRFDLCLFRIAIKRLTFDSTCSSFKHLRIDS